MHPCRLRFVCAVTLAGILAIAAGSAPASEFQVNTFTTSFQRFPAVAADASGGFVVVWHGYGSTGLDDSQNSVQAQLYSSVGVPFGGEFQVNTFTTGNQWYPAVATEDNGDFVVVWQSDGGSGTDSDGTSIQGQRYDAMGAALGGEFQVNSYTTSGQGTPALAMDSDGDFAVVWTSEGSTGGDTSLQSIQGQLYDSGGALVGGEFQVNSYTTAGQIFPSVASDSVGNFVVAWRSTGSYGGGDNDGTSIHAQRFNAAAAAQGSEFQVNSYTTGNQDGVDVSLETGGDFMLVWSSGGSPGSDSDGRSVQGQLYDNVGALIGSQFQVNSYTPSGQLFPTAALAATGEFVVVWHSYGGTANDDSYTSIRGRKYDASATADGPDFQVNSYTTGGQLSPEISGDPNGDFVVTWYSYGSSDTDTDGTSIQAPEPRASLLRITALLALAVLARTRNRSLGRPS